MNKKEKFLEKLSDIFFPHNSCPFCVRETKDGTVCKNCSTSEIHDKFCVKCGEHVLDNENICFVCKEQDRIFDQNFSCYEYGEHTASAIMALKYNDKKYLAKDFAKILFEKFKSLDVSVDIVTSVPMSAKAQKKRGYNHAEEIAKEFCKLSNIEYLNVLSKIKDTPRQAELDRNQRLQNLKGCFVCTSKDKIKNKNILIIDDVFTTGSTMTACSQEIKKAKPHKIYTMTVTKTKNPEL